MKCILQKYLNLFLHQYFIIKKKNKYSQHHFFIFSEEIELIINNIRYFIFETDLFGITQGITLAVYMYGDPYIYQDENISKIIYLSNNVKWHFHEILSHFNIRFNYYL